MRLRGILLDWLAAALLLAQTLALMHRVVHGPVPAAGHVAAVFHAQDGAHDHGLEDAHAGSWLTQLFAEHDEGGGCLVFDQHGHGDVVLAVVASILPLPAPALTTNWHGDCTPAATAVPFDARGPPFSSL